MPRRKVPLENRKRAAQACIHCRNSKKRCNGQQPCASCLRKGVGQACVFEDIAHSSASVNSNSSVRDNHLDMSERNIDTTPAIFSRTSDSNLSTHSPAITVTTTGTLASSPEASHRTHPRLLDNSQGEKVFFGGSASLAFLQLIRDTVSQSLGTSDFTDHAERNRMLEAPRTQSLPVTEILLLPEQEHKFLDKFEIASRGLLELHAKEYIIDIINRHRTNSAPVKIYELAIAQTSIAIGAQCSSRDRRNLTISRSYFAEAQRQAFDGMIEDPSLEMVQLFLLMAFYMFGACLRNAAFMYIGVAARAAHVLGMHELTANGKAVMEADQTFRKTWKCLVTLDTITSSILGRPSATSTQPHKDDMIVGGTAVDVEIEAAMQANYQLACLLDQKVQELYHSEKVTTEGAKACLDQLSSWSARLPSSLRGQPSSIQVEGGQTRVIGGLHVSCFYYFGVMLVSRPFLIVHLTNRLAKNRTGLITPSLEHPEALAEAEIREIADACLNAAVYMIQTCIETQDLGLLPNDMRILKAWVFAAGLVLGFEMFTVHQSDPEIEDAFRGSCNVLKLLATHSSQAAHNLEILTSFSDAITTRRRQALAARRRTGRPIVERIMAFQVPQTLERDYEAGAENITGVPQAPPAVGMGASNESTIPLVDFEFDIQSFMNEPFLNWDNADFLSWDPFSRESGP